MGVSGPASEASLILFFLLNFCVLTHALKRHMNDYKGGAKKRSSRHAFCGLESQSFLDAGWEVQRLVCEARAGMWNE